MEQTIKTIGLVGGNMLSAMLATEAKKRGIKTILLEPELRNIASDYVDQQMVATINDETLSRLALRTEAMILCTTNLNGQTDTEGKIPLLNDTLFEDCNIYPNRAGVELIGSPIQQLLTAQMCEIPTPKLIAIDNPVELMEYLATIQLPVTLYSMNQENYKVDTVKDLETMKRFLEEALKNWDEWLIQIESTYERVLSVSALVREGKVALYPIQEEKFQEEQVKVIEVPAKITQTMEKKIGRLIRKLLQYDDYEGLYTFKFGIKSNRSLELTEISSGRSAGDLATNHYTDLSLYEQYLNLIEGYPIKNAEHFKDHEVIVVKQEEKQYIPPFPYHQYRFDRYNNVPICIYVATKDN